MKKQRRGVHTHHGAQSWEIKFYGFESDWEIEPAQWWALGEHVKVGIKPINGNTMRGFEQISELLGRPIESYTAGRSGGWLVIETELTDEELERVDKYIEDVMRGLFASRPNRYFGLERDKTFHRRKTKEV